MQVSKNFCTKEVIVGELLPPQLAALSCERTSSLTGLLCTCNNPLLVLQIQFVLYSISSKLHGLHAILGGGHPQEDESAEEDGDGAYHGAVQAL